MPVGGTNRRTFIAALGGAAAWPLMAWGQQSMPTIGILSVGAADGWTSEDAAFRQGMEETGYVGGQNVLFEYRWVGSNADRLPAVAAELAARQVSVLVNFAGALGAARAATKTIPIVAMFASDPAQAGFVNSLNRPGGNITGVNMHALSLGPKRFEVLHELMPKSNLMAVLANPTMPNPASKSDLKAVEAAAAAVGQRLSILNASREQEVDVAFGTMALQKADALLVMSDPYFWTRHEQLVALAAHYSIPAVYEWREYVVSGGLMSYGSSLPDAFRRLGIYTGKVLQGAKPSDLPIEQAVKIELILNLKTAKTLGLTFPLSLLGRADEVIE